MKEITTNLHELQVTFVYKTTCTTQKDLLNFISSREKKVIILHQMRLV